jgi:hypothetical protein
VSSQEPITDAVERCAFNGGRAASRLNPDFLPSGNRISAEWAWIFRNVSPVV